jgi:hypothetical protein
MCVYGIMPKRRQMKRIKGGMWPFDTPATDANTSVVATPATAATPAVATPAAATSVVATPAAATSVVATPAISDSTKPVNANAPIVDDASKKKGLFGWGGILGGKSKKKSKRRSRSRSKSKKRR